MNAQIIRHMSVTGDTGLDHDCDDHHCVDTTTNHCELPNLYGSSTYSCWQSSALRQALPPSKASRKPDSEFWTCWTAGLRYTPATVPSAHVGASGPTRGVFDSVEEQDTELREEHRSASTTACSMCMFTRGLVPYSPAGSLSVPPSQFLFSGKTGLRRFLAKLSNFRN